MPTVDESMILSARRWMASSDSAWALVRPWCQMGEHLYILSTVYFIPPVL